jgi:hypothetical protein
MLKNIFGLSLLAVLFAGVSMAQKVTPESELRAIYRKLDGAMKLRDADKVTQYYDVDYTLENKDKKLSRSEAVSQWKEILGFIKSVSKLTTKIEKISARDGIYVVDYSQTSSGRIQFPQSPIMPFTYEGKVTDRWQRDKNGNWKNLSSFEHLSDLKVNGQSANPPGN